MTRSVLTVQETIVKFIRDSRFREQYLGADSQEFDSDQLRLLQKTANHFYTERENKIYELFNEFFGVMHELFPNFKIIKDFYDAFPEGDWDRLHEIERFSTFAGSYIRSNQLPDICLSLLQYCTLSSRIAEKSRAICEIPHVDELTPFLCAPAVNMFSEYDITDYIVGEELPTALLNRPKLSTNLLIVKDLQPRSTKVFQIDDLIFLTLLNSMASLNKYLEESDGVVCLRLQMLIQMEKIGVLGWAVPQYERR